MARHAGKGVILKRGDGASPESFTAVGQVFGGPAGPSYTQDQLDVTDSSSPSGFREFIGGLMDAGEVSGELHFDPSNATHNDAAGLIKTLKDGVLKNFQILFPDTKKVTFAALVTAMELDAGGVDGKLTASFTLKISGLPVWS